MANERLQRELSTEQLNPHSDDDYSNPYNDSQMNLINLYPGAFEDWFALTHLIRPIFRRALPNLVCSRNGGGGARRSSWVLRHTIVQSGPEINQSIMMARNMI